MKPVPPDVPYSTSLADITADMVSIARGFLGAYLSARRTAGRR